MGKSKQAKEKKFDRNVEISAPILDPEIIKAIHTPPKGQKLDIKHGGFKALLSDLNSQDSTDELTPLNDNHVPSYIGISCAVSGYSNYSSYSKKPSAVSQVTSKTAITNSGSTPNRSRATSPVIHTSGPEVHHITIDKNTVHSADEERKELTEKLTASATERRRSPSPCIPPTEDDRHHGAYVGARYCPLPAPSKIVNKHIPLLGIDDEQDPEEKQEEENKVEHRIASLYGGDFVEDWRESMTHKAKKELTDDQVPAQNKSLINPKDLVTLKPTPQPPAALEVETKSVEVPVPNVKVLANVEKQFLNKLLTDENPPVPVQPPSPLPGLSKSVVENVCESKITSNSQDEAVLRAEDIVQRSPIVESVAATATKDSTPASIAPSDDEHDDLVVIATTDMPVDIEKNNIASENLSEKLLETTRDDIITIEPVDHNIKINNDDVVESMESVKKLEATAQDDIVNMSPVNESLITMEDDLKQAQTIEALATEIRDDLVDMSSSLETAAGQQIEAAIQEHKLEAPISPDSNESKSFTEEELVVPASQSKEEHIEYEIRAQSPIDNESSPVKVEQKQSIEDCELEQKDLITGFEETLVVTSDSKDGHYYLALLNREKSFILEQVAKAEALLGEEDENSEVDEDSVGRLRSAIGKANLLINKKFNQFKELCDANINKKADEQFATLNDDLAGFWDMLSIQVSDVQKSFENLWTVQQQGEVSKNAEDPDDQMIDMDEEATTTKEPKEKGGSGKPKLSAQKDQKRRERLQEHISQMKKDQAAKMSNENLLDE